MLATFGFLAGEGAVPNETVGLGKRSVRLIALAPGEVQPVGDIRLSTDRTVNEAGVTAYRAVWMGSLYPPDVHVSAARPER